MSHQRKFKFYDQPFVIQVKDKTGQWVDFTAYDDYDAAVEHTNRIDRHRDVRLIKLPTDWESVINRKWDALRVYISRP